MALHKVQIMARDTSTTKEDYINLTDHKLAVDIGTTPDTAAGDLASMSADLETIQADIAAVTADIALMKADLATVKADIATITGKHLGELVTITQNSSSQSVTVPALARAFRISTRGGSANLSIGEAATSDSALYVPPECVDSYPIVGGVDTLYCYGVSGKAYFSFLG